MKNLAPGAGSWGVAVLFLLEGALGLLPAPSPSPSLPPGLPPAVPPPPASPPPAAPSPDNSVRDWLIVIASLLLVIGLSIFWALFFVIPRFFPKKNAVARSAPGVDAGVGAAVATGVGAEGGAEGGAEVSEVVPFVSARL